MIEALLQRSGTAPPLDTVTIVIHDTIRVAVDSAYVAILEKTNQQLGLLTNPYGIMVASQSVLFTVVAIVAGVILFRQSRDYKTQIEGFINAYKPIVEGVINRANEQVDLAISELRAELTNAKDDKTKQALEERIARLEKTAFTPIPDWKGLMSTGSALGLSSLGLQSLSSQSSYLNSQETFKCPKCGHIWTMPQQGNLVTLSVICPNCKQESVKSAARINPLLGM